MGTKVSLSFSFALKLTFCKKNMLTNILIIQCKIDTVDHKSVTI